MLFRSNAICSALDVEQIRHQLEHILGAEQIAFEPRALQLLSRAADGSLRDALSLTDQAIASGDGRLTAESVSAMLGTLDDDQALSLIEALVAADGERVMAGVNEAAARGVEWEALLVEMQSLLHRIAMVQLSPSALGTDMAAIELRMRELARTVPPTDVVCEIGTPAPGTDAVCEIGTPAPGTDADGAPTNHRRRRELRRWL